MASLGGHLFRCAACDAVFDDDPSEGGDFSDRFPDARLIREENREQRRQAKAHSGNEFHRTIGRKRHA
jgi:hypothetical protein